LLHEPETTQAQAQEEPPFTSESSDNNNATTQMSYQDDADFILPPEKLSSSAISTNNISNTNSLRSPKRVLLGSQSKQLQTSSPVQSKGIKSFVGTHKSRKFSYESYEDTEKQGNAHLPLFEIAALTPKEHQVNLKKLRYFLEMNGKDNICYHIYVYINLNIYIILF
jgi:hypothetical protein